MDYVLHVLVLIAIYTILSVSLNLISGYTGLLSVAHAALFGVGAYIAALLALHFHTSFIAELLCAAGGASVVSIVVAAPSLRVHDDYFVIATFAFQVIAFGVMRNWTSLTGGAMGLPDIPVPVVCGLAASSNARFLVLAALFAGLAGLAR